MAKEISDDLFEQEVLKSVKPVLVDFWAEWCGPCKILGPIIDSVSQDTNIKNKIKVFKMNIDKNPNSPSKYAIRSIPTMLIFKNGEVVSSKIGSLTEEQIKDWINTTV